MCRGDRREDIFGPAADRELFLRTLAEMCERCGILVHSYVLMSNHYHLLIETPQPNLVAGMKWFQGTYTQRFNARHRLCGHLFQGRYKAIPVEEESEGYFCAVSDYIHLNPARARLLDGDRPELLDYPRSSFVRFAKDRYVPPWLCRARVFGSLGLPDESAASRANYRRWMTSRVRNVLECELDEEESRHWEALKRGWYLGSENFRDRLMDWANGVVRGRRRQSYSGEALGRHDEAHAEQLLKAGMEQLELNESKVLALRKNDARKQALAWLIRSRTVLGDEWIVSRLRMGHRSNVSRAVAAFRDPGDAERKKLQKFLHACTYARTAPCPNGCPMP